MAHVVNPHLQQHDGSLPDVPASRPCRPRERVQRTASEVHYQKYMETLQAPTPDQIERIAQMQAEKEKWIEEKNGEEDAAGKIQRAYRDHRTRSNGLRLDATTRWTEAIGTARYRNVTDPCRRRIPPETGSSGGASSSQSSASRTPSEARQRWHRVGEIARHAHGRRLGPPNGRAFRSSSGSPSLPERAEGGQRRRRWRKGKGKGKGEWKGKMMDLPYFLEMVDPKHRYGSNLRAYQVEWKRADTHDNFFHWLDYGDGKDTEVRGCSRRRLEREQVRYLSREERERYLVVVKEGRLCWAKNGERVETSEEWKDSVEGIVRRDADVKAFREDEIGALREEGTDPGSDDGAVSILNRLLRRTTTGKDKWIFAADTDMRLYVGIKRPGGFQHSSFMGGARLSAAGVLRAKDGRLQSLSPLSGHYRPPAGAFRHLVAHLREQGADTSRVSIGKGYGVLVGLEAYLAVKGQAKEARAGIGRGVRRVLRPRTAAEASS